MQLSTSYLLIEFKRPSHALNFDDYQQATAYRHELKAYVAGAAIRVLLVGGSRSPNFPTDYREPSVEVRLFPQLIATARRQLKWLLRMDEKN